MLKTNLLNRTSITALILLSLLLPLVVHDQYKIHILITISILVILCTSLRVLYNTGLVSIAHGAFYAVGAYASALFTMKLGFSFWLALPASGIIAAVFGLAVGYPILKVKGIYFFLISFALTAVLTVFLSSYFENLFGGLHGLYGFPPPNPITIAKIGTVDFTHKVPYYYLTLAVLLVAVFIMYRLDTSRFGRVCKAIREADGLAESIGISVMKYKLMAFVIACFFAGIAGSLLAHYYMSINPAMFNFQNSMVMVIALFVGGSATIAGPIVGAAALTVLSQVFIDVTGKLQLPPGPAQLLLYGIVLVVFVSFLPDGLAGLPRQLRSLFKLTQRAGPAKSIVHKLHSRKERAD